MSVRTLANDIRSGKTSAVAVCDEALARIAKLEPGIGAFNTVVAERALERATRLIVDSAGGTPGPLMLADLADELPGRGGVQLRPPRARMVVGEDIADAEMQRHLESLPVVR